MFHGTLTTRMYWNRPQLTLQQIVNEARLFTFWHWTHGCDVNVVKNYLNIIGSFVSVNTIQKQNTSETMLNLQYTAFVIYYAETYASILASL